MADGSLQLASALEAVEAAPIRAESEDVFDDVFDPVLIAEEAETTHSRPADGSHLSPPSATPHSDVAARADSTADGKHDEEDEGMADEEEDGGAAPPSSHRWRQALDGSSFTPPPDSLGGRGAVWGSLESRIRRQGLASWGPMAAAELESQSQSQLKKGVRHRPAVLGQSLWSCLADSAEEIVFEELAADMSAPVEESELRDAVGDVHSEVDDERGRWTSLSITAATLNKLVQRLTWVGSCSSSAFADFFHCFFLTYPVFATAEELLDKLRERFNVPRALPAALRTRVQRSVCMVLIHWVTEYSADFTSAAPAAAAAAAAGSTLLHDLQEFVETEVQADQFGLAQQLLYAIARRLHTLGGGDASSGLDGSSAASKRHSSTTSAPSGTSALLSGASSPLASSRSLSLTSRSPRAAFRRLRVRDMTAAQFAQQLCLVNHALLAAIDPRELLSSAWSGRDKLTKAANVLAMIMQFNTTAALVARSIVSTEDVDDRVAMVEHFIGVAEQLRRLHDFHGLMAVLSALTSNLPVRRLKATWAAVASAKRSRLTYLQTVMSTERSYARYRDTLARSSLPVVPFLGVHLQDLLMTDGAASNYVCDDDGDARGDADDAEQAADAAAVAAPGGAAAGGARRTLLVNFSKQRTVFATLGMLRDMQRTPFTFMELPEARQLMMQQGDPHEDLMALSKQREPPAKDLHAARVSALGHLFPAAGDS